MHFKINYDFNLDMKHARDVKWGQFDPKPTYQNLELARIASKPAYDHFFRLRTESKTDLNRHLAHLGPI